jgi:hypothetical protein
MSEYGSKRFGTAVMQSAVPKRFPQQGGFNPKGLLIRGVVTATYVVDDPNHPRADQQPVAIYCDVLGYGNIPGTTFRYIKSCLVLQDRGAIHSGRIWKPRATTLDIAGGLDTEGGSNPVNLDGDHVLVGFMDNSFNVPVILGGLPHPNADLGNESLAVGQRKRLRVADGDPDFFRHHGAFYGISTVGDFVVDLTKATDGSIEGDGKETAPPGDGTVGNHRVKLPAASKYFLDIDGGPTIEIELKGSTAKLKLGDGAVHAAIYEALEDFWNNTIRPQHILADAHQHPTAMGLSGPPTVTLSTPVLDTAIKSTKVSFPDA